MPLVTFKGMNTNIFSDLPSLNTEAPSFTLVRGDLSEVSLENFSKKKKVLNIFPSLDTGVCATSVRSFNKQATEVENTTILHISLDLPFAQGRFCGTEGIKDSEALSAFRSSFSKDYGIEILDGPLKGLCARSVLVLDENNQVIYRELVSEITQEPDYAKVLDVIKNSSNENAQT